MSIRFRWLLAVAVVFAALTILLDGWLERRATTPTIEPIRVVTPARPETPRPRVAATPVARVPERAPEATKPAPPVVEPRRTLVGLVLDQDRRPTENVSVTLLDTAGSPLAQSISGSDGHFELDPGDGPAGFIVATSAEFASRTVTLPSILPSEPVEIELTTGAAVVGTVRLAGGGVPTDPVRIMALSPLGEDTLGLDPAGLARLAADRDARVHTTVAGADGSFELPGLRRGAWFRVFAGGPGLAVTHDMGTYVEAEAGGDPIEIVLAPTYLLDVRVRGPRGGPVRASPLLRSLSSGISWTGPMASAIPYGASSPGLQWAGLGDFGRPERGPYDLYIVYAGTNGSDRIGPFRLSVVVPGYRAVAAEVWAERTNGSESVANEIRLEQLADGFGNVRVRIDDGGSGFARAFHDAQKSAATLLRFPALILATSQPQKDGMPQMKIALAADPSGEFVVEGMPTGRFYLQLDLPLLAATVREPSSTLDVHDGETADVVVEVGEWSGLELRPMVGDGDDAKAYVGPLRVSLRSVASAREFRWIFHRPPYRIAGVAPGQYRVTAVSPGISLVEPVLTDLTDGEMTRVDVTLTVKPGPARESR